MLLRGYPGDFEVLNEETVPFQSRDHVVRHRGDKGKRKDSNNNTT